ncbi:toll-like receptor Tollo [Physella acuta]|uniref:toll-like receptor Tollo n=1 Tax=Physella acuta TaxID=109671 RepID=UPI0027DE90E7|nr:toll-like receptor Tollo [Physella acuta]XP_059150136.1 toll-like receptor Tollo [Physella acuta]
MAAGVSIYASLLTRMFLVLAIWTLSTQCLALTHTSHHTSIPTVNPFTDYICPNQCACYIQNETNSLPMILVNCTVAYFSPDLPSVTTLLRHIANPHTGTAMFTCSFSIINIHDPQPESQLWSGMFDQLANLRELTFTRCAFKNLYRSAFLGLRSLTKLQIQQANLKFVDPELLTFLPSLQVLEVSNSSLSHLFPVCQAKSLKSLRLSMNEIQKFEDAGLFCNQTHPSMLEVVDLSANQLTKVPQWFSSSLPHVFVLSVANNSISYLENFPFEHSGNMYQLDLTNNEINDFNSGDFHGLVNLRYLKISDNDVSSLPRRFLSSVSSIAGLEMASMGLDENVWMELTNLNSLMELDLSNNKISAINMEVMGQFLKLESLSLRNNNILFVHKDTFVNQTRLAQLDLSSNNLFDVPESLFRRQYLLKHLLLGYNRIKSIGQDAFAELKQLARLELKYNMLTNLPTRALYSLTNLVNLDLCCNTLTTLEPDLLAKTKALTYFNVSFNNLKEIPVLSYAESLQVVDLSNNVITSLLPVTFQDLQALKKIVLSNNQLTSLHVRQFKGCESLEVLDLSSNSLNKLDVDIFTFVKSIVEINLSNNQLTSFSQEFMSLVNLKILNLSGNKITQTYRGQFPNHVEIIDLSRNNIANIKVHTFKSLKKIVNVNLSYNNLTTLSRLGVEIDIHLGYSPSFDLSYNPFVCDCSLGWLKDWTEGKLKDLGNLPTFKMPFSFRCHAPMYSSLKVLQTLRRDEFLCPYKIICEENCMCCDYAACHCKYHCPSSCNCFIGDDHLNIHQVFCDSANLTNIPIGLPEGATQLRLDGNNISTLQQHTFLALKHVQELYLNNSQIYFIQNNTFKGLKAVQVIYLNNNNLFSIPAIVFKGLDLLEKLYLQNNDLHVIESNAFLNPMKLNLVNLQNNALSSVSLDEIWGLTNRSTALGLRPSIFLSGNPWTCDADFVCNFLHFLRVNSMYVPDSSDVECVAPNPTDKPQQGGRQEGLVNMQFEICADNQANFTNLTRTVAQASSAKTETYALIAACVVISFGLFLLIVAYFNRNFLQVLCFTRFGLRVFKMAKGIDDNERPYDAFISYSNKDEEFVIQQLAPRLENGHKKFRLCVHYRDFPVGACIAETIVRSVEASKRTILVVSDNFLDSEWCRFEFQTAHQQVLNERRNRVILILMHDLDTEKLDSTLRVYMRTRTYLKYDDPWFWEKLMFAMPDVRPRKQEIPCRIQVNRDMTYMPQGQQVFDQQPRIRTRHLVNGHLCETIHNDMYEIPVMETTSGHYQLANGVCCSTHTNSAYHNSDGSDSTSGYHNGSISGSYGHYEEVGPGSTSIQSTPQKLIGTPPPVPSIPKEGFLPISRARTAYV